MNQNRLVNENMKITDYKNDVKTKRQSNANTHKKVQVNLYRSGTTEN